MYFFYKKKKKKKNCDFSLLLFTVPTPILAHIRKKNCTYYKKVIMTNKEIVLEFTSTLIVKNRLQNNI
jgi:hypothetical protein